MYTQVIFNSKEEIFDQYFKNTCLMFFSNSVNRFWSIMKLHNGCPGDIGWLTGSFEPPGGCLFDLTTGSFPVFRACPGNSSCFMESGQYSYVYLYQFYMFMYI